MAFKPNYTQSYKLIAKNSQLALSLPDSGDFIQVEQHKPGTLKMQQNFRFDTEPHKIFIMPDYKKRFLCVHNSSLDNGAPIIRFQWEVKGNNQFQFLYAGEGYYRIRANHSGKLFDIEGDSRIEGAKLIQHQLNGGDNQLFRPVLVPGKSGVPAISFVEANELTRTVALALIGKIPEVGGGLAFITGYFWKEENKLANLWDQMRDYVEMRIDTKIMDERVKALESRLKGMIKAIREIEASTENDKGTLLLSIMYTMAGEEELLFDGSIEMLPYIAQFGTIMVGLRRALVNNYSFYYGHEANATTKTHILTNLKATITEYEEAVKKGVEAALTKRLQHVKNRVTDRSSSTAQHITNSTEFSYAEDTYTGWKQGWEFRTIFNGHRTDEYGYRDHIARADWAAEQRKMQITEQYTSMLEEFLNVAKEWQYTVPDSVRPTGQKVQKTVGAYGGKDPGSTVVTVPENGGRITKVIVHTGGNDWVSGIEVFYNGTSSGLLGKKGKKEDVLELSENDYITGVLGCAYNDIQSLSFCTHQGKLLEAGFWGKQASPEDYFYADLSDGLDSRLIGISGNGGDHVQQLSFKWEYAIKDPK